MDFIALHHELGIKWSRYATCGHRVRICERRVIIEEIAILSKLRLTHNFVFKTDVLRGPRSYLEGWKTYQVKMYVQTESRRRVRIRSALVSNSGVVWGSFPGLSF